jgi:CheY-like chemotaxis protein
MFQKLMIIDDSAIDRLIIKKTVIEHKFTNELIELESATEALNYLQSQKENPELIFLDLLMPDMDGFQFLDEYEKLPEGIKRRNIVIITSSISEADYDRSIINPYVLTYFVKPISEQKLNIIKTLVA